MSRVSKGRRKCYDNIAVASAITSVERTISGSLPPADATVGNTENIQNATDYGEERHVSGSTLMEGENVAVP